MFSQKLTLSNSEQFNFLKEYRSTDNEARKIEIKEILIHANFGFVRYFVSSLTKNVTIKCLEYDDYMMEAVAGLVESIDTFDVDKNVPLIGYAQFFMQKRVIQLINNNLRILKFPDRYNFESKMLQGELEKGSSFEDACSKVGISQEKAKAMEDSRKYTFVNINSSNEDGDALEQVIKDTNQIASQKEVVYGLLNKLIDNLNDTEKKVIFRFYGLNGEDEYNAEIGRDLGLCRERIRQINKAACRKLKTGLGLYNISRDIALT